jgi:hypothetical protein
LLVWTKRRSFAKGFPNGNDCVIDHSSAVTLPLQRFCNDTRILDNQQWFGKSWFAHFPESAKYPDQHLQPLSDGRECGYST